MQLRLGLPCTQRSPAILPASTVAVQRTQIMVGFAFAITPHRSPDASIIKIEVHECQPFVFVCDKEVTAAHWIEDAGALHLDDAVNFQVADFCAGDRACKKKGNCGSNGVFQI